MEGYLGKLLAAAEELEELTIDFDRKVDDITLEKFLGSLTWPHLRSIRLFRKEVDEEEFVDFLKRHVKKIKIFCLEFVTSGVERGWTRQKKYTAGWL